MKKRALVAGVLLSIFSMGMSAQAAMTIDGSSSIVNITDEGIYGYRNTPAILLNASNSSDADIIINFQPPVGDKTPIFCLENGLQCNSSARTFRINGKLAFEEMGIVGYDASADRASIFSDGQIEFNDEVYIHTNEHKAINVEGGFMDFNKSVDIQVNGYSGDAITNYGTLNFARPSQIINADGVAIDNSGAFFLNSDNVDGNTFVVGNIVHNTGASTELNIRGASSYLKGNIYGSDEGFHLNLSNGASWIIDSDPTEAVTGVSFNGGSIYLYEVVSDPYHTLKLNNFSSDGNFSGSSDGFHLRTNLEAGVGDKLEFTGTTPNIRDIPLYVIDESTTIIEDTEGRSVTLVTAPSDTNMDFSTSVSARYSPTDSYLYQPTITTNINGNKKEWKFDGWNYMTPGPIDPDPWNPGYPSDPSYPSGPSDPIHKTVEKEKDQHGEGFTINASEIDNTLKRINDIRTDPSEVGAWIRGESGKMKIRSYSYKYNLTSGGYDWDFDSNAAKMFLGFGISYAKNDCDTGMIGDTKSMGYNLYGSWLGKENKDYIDVILKYGKLDKKYAGLDDNNVFVRGDYDKNLFSIAAKYGRRIEREDGWYYEPSVGLTWGRIGSADFTDSQGIHIHADSSTSKMASLGMQVGKNVQGTEFYGLVQVRHDFDGKMHVSVPGSDLPGSSVYDDMGGTWYKVGIGAARKINKNNSFYLDLEKDFGNKVKKPYSIGAGYRYTW